MSQGLGKRVRRYKSFDRSWVVRKVSSMELAWHNLERHSLVPPPSLATPVKGPRSRSADNQLAAHNSVRVRRSSVAHSEVARFHRLVRRSMALPQVQPVAMTCTVNAGLAASSMCRAVERLPIAQLQGQSDLLDDRSS
jgi:hypothetical protein